MFLILSGGGFPLRFDLATILSGLWLQQCCHPRLPRIGFLQDSLIQSLKLPALLQPNKAEHSPQQLGLDRACSKRVAPLIVVEMCEHRLRYLPFAERQ
jgi:hypothetical protein